MSIKKLIRRFFRATIIIRIEAFKTRECEVVDLTKEPDISMPAPMPRSAVVGAKGDVQTAPRATSPASSRTMSPATEEREGTPSPNESHPELPTASKGKEPLRAVSSATATSSTPETTAGPSGATATEASSSSTTAQQPSSPPRHKTTATATAEDSLSRSSRKRRNESPDPFVIKREPGECSEDDDDAAAPVKKEESDSDEEVEEEEDDDDAIQISPFKRRRSNSPDLSSIPFAPAPFQRSFSPSPGGPPPPFHHPDFPTRPALRCPERNRAHQVIERDQARSTRNAERWYFRCRDCREAAARFGGFICWADTKGVRPDNPRCWCGHPARGDLTGDTSQQPDTLWYKCAIDTCKFRRYDWDDPLSPEEVNEYCGRQVYTL
ncbi:hypothetical protein F4819DRAFT_252339 [Hypoxylon fuscum]|nr:hypothetical protein F4819DRAFT_252339 [Hypoxylon fuscum]